MLGRQVPIFSLASAVVFALGPTALYPEGDHNGGHDAPLETMREMHSSHEHEHDFGVMDEVTDEQRERLNSFLTSVGLVIPPMSSHRGGEIYLEKAVWFAIRSMVSAPKLARALMPQPCPVR